MDWNEQYETERGRLIEALGKVTDGGIVESIQHIGATSVPGLRGSSCIDIGLAVWPFPLEEGPRSRLEAMDYQIVDPSIEGQQFLRKDGTFQLFVIESGIGAWFDLLLIRDYLRQQEEACKDVSARKKDAALDKSLLFRELLSDAQTWWIENYGFSPLEEVTHEMMNAPFEWYISGGWALELFTGRVQRVHHDVDIIVPRRSQLDLQNYLTERGWRLITPFEKRSEPWPPHMQLELPRHQIHAYRNDNFMDLLLTDMDDVWRYRRESLILRSKEKMSLRTASGIPYLAPELVLLFKSKNTSNHERPKDQLDFEKALPHLEPERRAWLYWALMATSPDHAWIQTLMP